jgi:hypothetical protein
MDSYALSGDENVLLYFGDDVTRAGNTMTSGGPLTTGYVPPPALNPPTGTPTVSLYPPPPAPPLTVLPASLIPESKSVVLLPPSDTSFLSPIAKTPKIKQETKNLTLVSKSKTKEKNLSTTGKENTASVINAFTNQSTNSQPTPTPKKNWFRKLLDNIFGGF